MLFPEDPIPQIDHEGMVSRTALDQVFDANPSPPIVKTDMVFDHGSYQQDIRNQTWYRLVRKYETVFSGLGRAKTSQEEDAEFFSTYGRYDFLPGEPGTADYARPGEGKRKLKELRLSEASAMAALLFSPLTDGAQIRERQQILENLSADGSLDGLVTAKNAAHKLIVGIDLATRGYRVPMDKEKWDGVHTTYVSLIDLYNRGFKTIPIFDDDSTYDPDFGRQRSRIVGQREVQPLVEEAVDMISAGVRGVKDFFVVTRGINDPAVRQAAFDLSRLLPRINADLNSFLTFDKTKHSRSEMRYGREVYGSLSELSKEVRSKTLEIGVVLEFARKIRDEEWGKVTFDPDKPYGYNGGWSLDRKKDRQVRNDGTSEAPIVLLSGANTSGKSFAMESDFQIRIAAQSLGFAPVEGGNLPIATNFVHIDRSTTDGGNDLSAFMKEVKDWNTILGTIEPGTRLYVDEGFSTTSPEDQARLLSAVANYVVKRGGSVMLATHNDVILSAAQQHPDMAIYHLQVEVGEKGELIRHFKLRSGFNESFALAAAKAANFPRDIVDSAEKYIRGEEALTVALNHSYPEIEAFTQGERERKKSEAASLDFLFPESSGLAALDLLSFDPEFNAANLLRNFVPKWDRAFEEWVYSEAPEEMLGRMILWTQPLSPAEIIERQKMFGELTRENGYTKLHEVISQVRFFEETYATIASHMKDGTGLNLFKKMDRKDEGKSKWEPNTTHLSAAIAFLRIQQKFLGDKFQHSSLLDRLSGLRDELDEEQDGKLEGEQLKRFSGLVDELVEVDDAFIKAPFKIDIRDISQELSAIERLTGSSSENKEKATGIFDLIGEGGLIYALKRLPQDLEKVERLVETLKATDSIYLNQSAAYIDRELEKIRAVLRGDGVDTKALDLKSLYSYFTGEAQKGPFKRTIRQLDALCMFADVIQTAGFAPVSFNDTGEVQLSDTFSFFKKKGEQVSNDITLSAQNERVGLLTGPNGSGKTFYEKDAVMAILASLATGYAPAQRATMPVFDSVVYLDRVVQEQDLDLSAFAKDLKYWDKLLAKLQTKRAVFATVDEAFSSTSPAYQAALTYAVIGRFLQERNHFLMVSTHNHELVDRLDRAALSLIKPYHFEFEVEDGKIVFHYTKKEGHEASHAIEVARKMGLPEEIVSLATK